MCAMRNSLPFISPCPFATTASNPSRNSFTILLESMPSGAQIAVSAAAGDAAYSFNPRAFAPARVISAQISALLTSSSRPLAIERGAFPLLDADQYLAAPRFASRLPDQIKDKIREHGLRNSHLLSIAPTGTISLAFADNASNGIEPAFSWFYTRKKRMAEGGTK